MRNIYLHGSLSKYGECLKLDVGTAGEAVNALAANFPEIIDDSRDGSWIIMRGDPDTGMALDEEAIVGLNLGEADLHFMPEIAGAKRSGVLKAIVGIALIATTMGSAGFLAQPISGALFGGMRWGGAIGQMGLALSIAGVSSLLSSPQESENNEESYLATGPTSTGGQGSAVPIVYGEVVTGGIPISGGVDAYALEVGVDEASTFTTDHSGLGEFSTGVA